MTNPEDIEWTTEDWVKKLKQQAMDSREYRHKLYQHVDLTNCERVLDVGCGTGAITMDIAEHTKGDIIGIDPEEHNTDSECIECHNPHNPDLEDM